MRIGHFISILYTICEALNTNRLRIEFVAIEVVEGLPWRVAWTYLLEIRRHLGVKHIGLSDWTT